MFELVFAIIILSAIYSSVIGAPWVPTRRADIERTLTLGDVREGEVFVDAGCGDGRLLCEAATKGADAHGYEVSVVLFFFAHIRRFFHPKRDHIHLHFSNFFHTPLVSADCVYVFLMKNVFPELREKIEHELKEGTRVITYSWPIPGWEPDSVSSLKRKTNIFLYKMKRESDRQTPLRKTV